MCIRDRYKEQIKKYQENCLNRHSKASELILLMKHYQKDNSSSRQVKNLLQSFDALYNSLYATKIKKEFDIVALNSIKNYLYNCKLSINIENPEYTIENLKTDLLEINDIQNETRIYNYFPYYKALTFLSKKRRIHLRLKTIQIQSKIYCSFSMSYLKNSSTT